MFEKLLYLFLRGAFLAVVLIGFFLVFYLLFRLARLVKWLRKSPEERRELRARKAAAAGYPLARASGRERTAYLISCLEQALAVYSVASGEWRWVLEQLRALPDVAPEPFFRVAALLPANVLPYERQEGVDAIYEDLMEQWDPAREQEYLPEERFRFLRALYQEEGWRMCVFAPLLLAVYDHAYAVREYGDAPVTGAMEIIREAESLLYCWNIPRPAPEGVLPDPGGDFGRPL